MNTVLTLFGIQFLLGAIDNFWHHEWIARLPKHPGARRELVLHALRELIYGVVFAGIAWRRWDGLWGAALVALLAIEVVVTLADFVEEDRSRRLPETERVLHTVMAILYGAVLAAWTPALWRSLQLPTALVPVDHGAWSVILTVGGTGVFAWGLRNLAAVARLGIPEWQRHPLRAGTKDHPRTILVTGGTGFVGSALVRHLVAGGDHVVVLSRTPALARDRFGPFVEVIGSLDEVASRRPIHAIVNLAGEPLAGGLWTAPRKQRFADSRTKMAAGVLTLIDRLQAKPGMLVCASATGFYGDRGDERLDETSVAGRGYLPALTRLCEDATSGAEAHGVRVCRLRIGYVLGAGGGMLGPLVPATRLGGGAILGSGRQWVSWIHLDDLVGLIVHALDRPGVEGIVNAVAPEAVTQRDFTKALARALRRPVLVRIPGVALRTLLGGMADLLLASQKVVPARAQDFGYTFVHTDLDRAFAGIVGGTRTPASASTGVTTGYANLDCPVCSAEMARYRRCAERCGAPLVFSSVGAGRGEAARYGLDEADLRRRMFVQRPDGRLLSGIDAFIDLWSLLPRWRTLAAFARLPGVHSLFEALYDGVCAPALTAWNERRLRRLRHPVAHRSPG